MTRTRRSSMKRGRSHSHRRPLPPERERPAAVSGERLANLLVERGLRSKLILEYRRG